MQNVNTAEAGAHFHFDRSWHELLAREGLSAAAIAGFQTEIYRYFRNSGREFSWRSEITPYRVLVSEIMLQQTQTSRVSVKFEPFVAAFPGFAELATAPFGDVLRYWKGLGYNRRAKYLHDCAGLVVSNYGGDMPDDPEVLVTFPGIGKATAASICVFAFNKPHPFIETNIRTVFIHCFFPDQDKVADRDIMTLVERTLDTENPRHWFYALMDYGVMLKKQVGNVSRKSRHYQKQSPFTGSDRQLRGQILQQLLDHRSIAVGDLPDLLGQPPERLQPLVDALCAERLITERSGRLRLA